MFEKPCQNREILAGKHQRLTYTPLARRNKPTTRVKENKRIYYIFYYKRKMLEPNYHESVLILTELTSVFTAEKDVQLILDVKEKETTFRERHEASQAEMKKTIRALTAGLQKIESKAQRKEPKEQFKAKVANLTKEEEIAHSNIDKMSRTMKKLEEDLSRLVLREEDLSAKAASLARSAEEELPRLQHLLSLYRAISHIEWADSDVSIEGRAYLFYLLLLCL